jgi:hypothetical protein
VIERPVAGEDAQLEEATADMDGAP